MNFLKGKIKRSLVVGSVYVLIFVFCFLVILNNPLFIPSFKLLGIVGFLQRYSALVAFVLLSLQIFLGAAASVLFKKFGEGVYRLHFINGILTYFLIFLHPLSYFVYFFVARRLVDPFFIFSDFCLVCETKTDLYLSFGRFAFWFFSAGFLSGALRGQSWWRENWKYLHVLNYIAFALVAFHAWKLGSDIHSLMFLPVFVGGVVVVLISLLGKIYIMLRKDKQK